MTESSRAFAHHDHAHCAGDTLARAEAEAARLGLRFTPVRKRVLQILLEAHRAMGAYEVLDRLASEGYGNQPPVAYRALEFLVEAGLAHRVQRLNAFAACMHPGEVHAPVFLICRDCDSVAEAAAAPLRAALDGVAAELGFAVERASFEAVGLCPACRDKVEAAAETAAGTAARTLAGPPA
jgi:Fur family zinc uptake transcriptional regulator